MNPNLHKNRLVRIRNRNIQAKIHIEQLFNAPGWQRNLKSYTSSRVSIRPLPPPLSPWDPSASRTRDLWERGII
jgi:hypothetical protein